MDASVALLWKQPTHSEPDRKLDPAIAFTPSTLVNNNGDLVQVFGGDTSGNGVANTGNSGAIACVVK